MESNASNNKMRCRNTLRGLRQFSPTGEVCFPAVPSRTTVSHLAWSANVYVLVTQPPKRESFIVPFVAVYPTLLAARPDVSRAALHKHIPQIVEELYCHTSILLFQGTTVQLPHHRINKYITKYKGFEDIEPLDVTLGFTR